MGKSLILKFRVDTILEYLMALLLVLECNTVYQRMEGVNLHFDWLCVIVSLMLALSVISKGMSPQYLSFVGLLLILLLFYSFLTFNKSNIFSFFKLLCFVFPCLMIYLLGKDGTEGCLSLYKKFTNIVVWLTVLSTVVWFGTEIIHVIQPNMSVRILWGTDHTVNGVWGVFFRCQRDTTFGLGDFYRNSGIFCEAPMFSLVNSFALIYELFLRSSYKKNRIAILGIGILTSIATTGILVICASMVLLYWKQVKTKRNLIKVFYVAGALFLTPLVYSFLIAVFEMKSLTGSYSIRTVDYIVGFNMFLKYPLTGSGFNYLSNMVEEQTRILSSYGIHTSSVGFSNSIAAILGQGGIYLFSIYLLPFVLMNKRDSKVENRNYSAWVISFMLLFVLTIFHAKMIMMYFLALAYVLCFKFR